MHGEQDVFAEVQGKAFFKRRLDEALSCVQACYTRRAEMVKAAEAAQVAAS